MRLRDAGKTNGISAQTREEFVFGNQSFGDDSLRFMVFSLARLPRFLMCQKMNSPEGKLGMLLRQTGETNSSRGMR